MKIARKFVLAAVAALTVVLAAAAPSQSSPQSTCTPTGFTWLGTPLTAFLIDPTSVTGTVDAMGCNIAVYYDSGSGTVSADISDANYFGVLNNGGHVTVDGSSIHGIRENPLAGGQHGFGVYFLAGNGATGSITNNTVSDYQKGGIVVNGQGASQVPITGNTITGAGPTSVLSQEGIEVGGGALTGISDNTISDNSYTGSLGATGIGILLYGGACYDLPMTVDTAIADNTLLGNDNGVYVTNLDGSCNPPATATSDTVTGNTIENNAVNNTSGWGTAGSGYQTGVTDSGNHDQVRHNTICGAGYHKIHHPPPYLFYIDGTFTKHLNDSNNTTRKKCKI